jgi:hypothetical protein
MADFGISEAYLAYAAMATAGAAAATSAYAAHQQGVASSRAANYQAAVALNNQKIAQGYAQAEIEKGKRLEESKRMQTAQVEGNVRAAAGASGLEVNAGSPVRLQADTARLGELDAQTIRNNSQRAAYGYTVQGLNYSAQAGLDEMTARDASSAGQLGAFSSIIGGASGVSDKWLKYQQAGVI